MNLKKTLDTWATELSKKASESATSLQESTDAFKAVAGYYAAQQKHRKKSDEDEPDEGGFNFEGANGSGSAKAPARRNS